MVAIAYLCARSQLPGGGGMVIFLSAYVGAMTTGAGAAGFVTSKQRTVFALTLSGLRSPETVTEAVLSYGKPSSLSRYCWLNSFCAGESVGRSGAWIVGLIAPVFGSILARSFGSGTTGTTAAGSNSTMIVAGGAASCWMSGAHAPRRTRIGRIFFTTTYLSVCEIRSGCCASCWGDAISEIGDRAQAI